MALPQVGLRRAGPPRESLPAMPAAGREALEWRRILRKTGDKVVGEVIRHEGAFYIYEDRRLEVVPEMPVDLDAQVAALEAASG